MKATIRVLWVQKQIEMKCAAGADFWQILHPSPSKPPRKHTEICRMMDVERLPVCPICLFLSPDLDGYRAPKTVTVDQICYVYQIKMPSEHFGTLHIY